MVESCVVGLPVAGALIVSSRDDAFQQVFEVQPAVVVLTAAVLVGLLEEGVATVKWGALGGLLRPRHRGPWFPSDGAVCLGTFLVPARCPAVVMVSETHGLGGEDGEGFEVGHGDRAQEAGFGRWGSGFVEELRPVRQGRLR